MKAATLHPDRLFPVDPGTRAVARELFAEIAQLPIVSVHGHVDAWVLVEDRPFPDAATLLVSPDHYVTRLLHSQGVPLGELGVGGTDVDPRVAWRHLCRHWAAFRGTASRLWLEQELIELFGVELPLGEARADETFEHISRQLAEPGLRPRALYERFGLALLATTDGPLDDLSPHRLLREDPSFPGRVVPTFRPDQLTDPRRPGWHRSIEELATLTDRPTGTWDGLLEALARRREDFLALGALATDHAPFRPTTADLELPEARRLFERVRAACDPGHRGADLDPRDADLFSAQMLTEMARMSCDDGLVMQLHPGVRRDYDRAKHDTFGPDVGFDFPVPVAFVEPLRPLVERFGSDPRFTLVLYTVDETVVSRELAPLVSAYPALRLGAPWWFLDAPDAMARAFSQSMESAGLANGTGFVDDTRAFCSIPARHDVARRLCSAHLARLVTEHRLSLDEAHEEARAYTDGLPRQVFKVP